MIIKRKNRKARIAEREQWHRVWRFWQRINDHEIIICSYVMRRCIYPRWEYRTCAEFAKERLSLPDGPGGVAW